MFLGIPSTLAACVGVICWTSTFSWTLTSGPGPHMDKAPARAQIFHTRYFSNVRGLPPERPYHSPSVCTTPAVPGSLLAAVAPLLDMVDEAKAPSLVESGCGD